jgi:hypothetical protein
MSPTTNHSLAALTALLLVGGSGMARADHPSIAFGTATAGPITTISAATLPQGMKSIGLQVEYVKSKGFSDQQLLDLDAQGIDAHGSDSLTSTSLGFGYGVTADFTVGVRLPYVERSDLRAVHHGSVERLGSSSGMGDMTILGKYRAINSPQDAYQAALLLGVKARSGDTSERNSDGEPFSAEHQPGSGSWDGLLGAAASKAFGRTAVDASVLYAFAGNGTQDTRLGDRMQYNVAVSHRLGGEEAPHAHHLDHSKPHVHGPEAAWDLVLEINGEWQGRQEVAGVTDEHSGGTLVYLSPGVRLGTGGNWSANLSVGAPVVQKLRAAHAETDYRVLAGFSMSF